MGITTLIQSSSATTALLVALTTTGSITIEIAFPFVLGANIGTTVTALLSSITANRTAKKAAMIHLLFNVTGVLLLLPLGAILIQAVTVLVPENIRYQISFLHLLFNVASTLILLPFTGTLIRMANVIVGEEYEIENQILDRRLLQTPSIAEGQVVLETVKLAQLAKLNVKLAIEAYLDNDVSKFDLITENEKKIDEVTLVITDFLVELSANEQAVEEFKRIGHTYHVLNDIERIGDHAENILELAVERNRNAVEITEEGKEELNIIYALTDLALHTAIRSYETRDRELACSIIETERQIDSLQKEYRNAHIQRLQAEKCSALSSILFLDVISNLERVGDHAKNIADTIVEACEN
jgi:phosphate:Na+ symporter